MPRYCKQGCRQRAYELRTAERRRLADLDAGRIAAVPAQRVVERIAPWPSDLGGWERALRVLEEQLRDGTLPVRDHARIDWLLRQLLTKLDRPSTTSAAAPATPAGAQLLDLPAVKLVDAVLVELGTAARPVTLSAVASRARVGVDVARGAVAALQTTGQVRLVGAGDVTVDATTVAEHARWRALRTR
ncbi:hypothetical protein [Catellatospora tritici]|uniref:hypothetical protein n=1 Tax=Catellatospora tritici TaxID=2851566 RepID=UPI001C2D3B65|nr:hypothetical protein [Catellatospora tritici]MBV1855730.1 hypothetical protein [Catellatospora tritici]